MNSFLTPQLEARLKKTQFVTRTRLVSGQQGNRRATGFGRSLDFSDYRSYHYGDDLRQIDWNVYARTNKHYIKRFLDEKEMQVAIYIDCSKSMRLDPLKWLKVQQVTSFLALIGFANGDRMSVLPIQAKTSPFLQKKGAGYYPVLNHYLHTLMDFNHEAFFKNLIKVKQHRASLHVFLTDTFEETDDIIESIQQFQSKDRLIILQVMTKDEIEPTIRGDKKVIDSETDSHVNVTIQKKTINSYVDRLNEHIERLRYFCQKRGISIVQMDVDAPLESLFVQLKQEQIIM
ncbi:DUF58 domain-containing protein [Alkalihalobacillus pseudalcaliphilus]|uniref:DUF58 domain-containing protein n=1 Tax=Alkalihalobacillus pseudalcaliphilus TaxID=79884 RepID=UPI00069EFE82|nr:DUF58 domain-containing protein [Alkalihalobacillus pseudalcaliphilus]